MHYEQTVITPDLYFFHDKKKKNLWRNNKLIYMSVCIYNYQQPRVLNHDII
jgi:hypothetical protein